MRIKVAIVDKRIPHECERALMLRGFRVITLPPSSRLPVALASHTDMLICRLGDDYITSADYLEEAPFGIQEIYDLLHPRFHFTADLFGAEYPRDAIFNCLSFGNRLFCKADTVSGYVLDLARNNGYEVVRTKQGYPACTVLKLNDEAAITADRGMSKLLLQYGIRVYEIKDGGIMLPPYEYGFIGGAGGVYVGNIYFVGDVTKHPSYEVIKRAAEGEGLGIISLGTTALLDVGGILFAEADVD